MDKALGFVEYSTVSAGITASDAMVKSADVEILDARTVCPGKYIVLVSGKLSSVNAAVEVGRNKFSENLIDSFILGNPDGSLFSAINGTAEITQVEALGIIETFTAASIIVAADTAAKTAWVNLIEIRMARGMCGKSFVLMTGELTAVEASVQAACKIVAESGMLLAKSVIPNPDRRVWESLL